MRSNVRTMKSRFSRVQSLIRNNIKENTDRKALAAHVSGMHLLIEEHEKKVADASEVDEIFYILPKYWSILDFGNLDDIVETFCSHECEAKKELDLYKGEVQRFCERRVSEFPPGCLSNGTNNEGMDKLIVTLDLKNPSLGHVRDLKKIIANILGLPASKLVLYDIIGRGNVVVTVLMATWLGEKLLLEATGTAKTLTQKQEDQLLEIKVVSLEFKEITVFSIHHQQVKKGNARLYVCKHNYELNMHVLCLNKYKLWIHIPPGSPEQRSKQM